VDILIEYGMINDQNLQQRLSAIWSAHFKQAMQINAQAGFVHQIKILD